MNIKKELDEIFQDPLLDLSEKEAELFDIPGEMRNVIRERKNSDYVAQRQLCKDFNLFQSLFTQIHKDLKHGLRSLMKISKTASLQAGRFYVVDGELLYLERIGEQKQSSNSLPDARTRCIYENGTESDILLQTLRKNVVGSGYAVTELEQESESDFFNNGGLTEEDNVTGYIYILSSLSDNPTIHNQDNLYKIGFSTKSVEERIANAEHEPTYLMAPVKIVATYKVANVNSQKLEDLIHQVLKDVQFHVTVIDDEGKSYEPKEWFVVPLEVVDVIIQKILDGSIIHYTYNPTLQCLEKIVVRKRPTFNTTGMKILSLNTKLNEYEAIVDGSKKIERRQIKQSSVNKYTYVDEADGKRYLRRYDAIRFNAGTHGEGRSALVQVTDTAFEDGDVIFHLGIVLDVFG